ncbi:hypothetical protein H6F32_05495 [Anabaena sp. FACHB-1237]|uniref:hypothetical protein n=1 Tax=Anabaena sp. FACHB-1237 TaxID=2692769 RepID=UPI001680EBE7|nr:hypothetical protein [Anabaena sp. FACHB-1237]MBD2137050.1 hypothetical protein [Anabaena sp. FACHB-1237]
MNSDLMPSSQSSNSATPESISNKIESSTNVIKIVDKSSKLDKSSLNHHETDNSEHGLNREQPIPPPSEPTQYRAIGLIRGIYRASSEQFTQGTLVTTDGVELNSVLLGRIMSLVKNHLDLNKEHLWVVYPRTRQESDALHLQIVGVWEPENLAKQGLEYHSAEVSFQKSDVIKPSSAIPDGGFSVRGEVVYQSFEEKSLVVKIKQAPRKAGDKPKYFKLKLKGVLTTKAVGKFWDFHVKRQADILIIDHAEAITDLPKKVKPSFRPGFRSGSIGRKPFPPRRIGDTPRPTKRIGADSTIAAKPIPKVPTPKPIKKPKSQE